MLLNFSNFFSSGLRQKVGQLMDILWSGGVNNRVDPAILIDHNGMKENTK
jgi:hypothetical protein